MRQKKHIATAMVAWWGRARVSRRASKREGARKNESEMERERASESELAWKKDSAI